MAELPFDVLEKILVGLDVEDLIRCKSVCKSWQSFVSSSHFVKAHLQHSYKNDRDNHELGHRRIACASIVDEDNWFSFNLSYMVGSCNGLVCVSPRDVEIVVTNPSTREEKTLQTPPYRPNMRKLAMARQVLCWGFGYDSATEDYKVIAGFRRDKSKKRTLFHVLTLKSNTWKVIGEVKYRSIEGKSGIFCGGALHWFMEDAKRKKVILSLDLSTEEFKEIPQPTHEEYEYDDVEDEPRLGVIEECLCIYASSLPLSKKKWVMQNDKWELYNDDSESKYDVAHCLTEVVDYTTPHKTNYVYSHDGGRRESSAGEYIRASIFVKSLVSPNPHPCVNNKNERHVKQQWQEGNGCAEGDGGKGSIKTRKRKRKSKTLIKKAPTFPI